MCPHLALISPGDWLQLSCSVIALSPPKQSHPHHCPRHLQKSPCPLDPSLPSPPVTPPGSGREKRGDSPLSISPPPVAGSPVLLAAPGAAVLGAHMDGKDSQRFPWARTLSGACFCCAYCTEGETEVWRDEAVCSRLYSLELAQPGFEHSSACPQSECLQPLTFASTPSKRLVQRSSTSPVFSGPTPTLTGNRAPDLPMKKLKLHQRSPLPADGLSHARV